MNTKPQQKKPGLATGPLIVEFDERSLRRFIRDSGIVAFGVGVAFGFTVGAGFGFGLGAAARALGELAFDFLDRFGLGHMLHDGDFTRQAVERGFIELTFA